MAAYFVQSAMKGPSLIFRVKFKFKKINIKELSSISNKLDLPCYAYGSCDALVQTTLTSLTRSWTPARSP